MVAKEVEVVSRSWQEGAEAVRWTCDGTTTYTIDTAERDSRGTDVILHLADDAKEYLEGHRIQEILRRYCRFLPVEVVFEEQTINNPNPLWKHAPAELEDQQYLDFFRELYPLDEDPLFWIHLNIDHPFQLNGILYFPRIRQDIDPRRNKIQLYSRQVFITDEVNQIVPDYLMLLQGAIDSPDIPLNVSRSYLQGDPNIKKISSYITRKVADKLKEIFHEDRQKFEEKWKDISVFVKYGMITDTKFDERSGDFFLLHNVDGNFFTLEEYREKIAPQQTDKDGNVVYLYATHPSDQDLFIGAAQAKGYDVVVMDGVLDSHLIQHVEAKTEKSRWVRVDADTIDKLVPKETEASAEEGELVLTEEQKTKLKDTFTQVISLPGLTPVLEKMGPEALPVLITRPEFMRRMRDMAAVGGGATFMGQMPDTMNLVINTQHPLVTGLIEAEDPTPRAKQLVDLALLGQNMLTGKDLTAFIQRSVDLMK
ncbi:MAG: molecular chaperone HtpG [Bacteroidetes bacterium]|nr:MAG: molecular chaperone HtpG [Bacteroidota bacterium]